SDDFTAATTADAFRQTQAESGSDDADLVLVSSRAGFGSAAAVAAISQVRPDVKPFSNDELVSRFNENGFAYFRQISFVLSSITLGFAFLLIATLLTMSVNQRLGQVAGLRALGIPRRRIAAALLWAATWLLGCVDTPTSGSLIFEGREAAGLSESERSRIRLTRIGFVFQRFFLLPMLSAAENIELPQAEVGTAPATRRARTRELLDYVGLVD